MKMLKVNFNFSTSLLANDLYSLMDDYYIEDEIFDSRLLGRIADYLKSAGVPSAAEVIRAPFNLSNEGVCGVSWVENGKPQILMFNYIERE